MGFDRDKEPVFRKVYILTPPYAFAIIKPADKGKNVFLVKCQAEVNKCWQEYSQILNKNAK